MDDCRAVDCVLLIDFHLFFDRAYAIMRMACREVLGSEEPHKHRSFSPSCKSIFEFLNVY